MLKYLKHFGIPLRETGVALRPFCVAYGRKVEKRQQVIFKREADAMQKMTELRQQGFTYESIAQVLNSMKVPTKTHKGKWHRKTVQAILSSQVILSTTA